MSDEIKNIKNEDQGASEAPQKENSENNVSAQPLSENEPVRSPAQTELSYGGFKNKWSYDEYEKNSRQRKLKTDFKGLKIFAAVMTMVCLVTVSCLVAVIAGGYKPVASGNQQQTETSNETQTQTPVIQIPMSVTSGTLSNKDIIKKAKPSVVGIIAVTQINGKDISKSIGSGFIIKATENDTDKRYIITNCHVVEDSTKVTVVLKDGSEYPATVVGTDSLTDIAVLHIDAEELPSVELGDSDKIEEGDPVIAIGTPAGIEFAGTSTHGMVSAINRDVKITNDSGNVIKTMTVIQIDASINPGNSGGPLLNQYGQVIGINTLKLADGYEGMGFAIPINGVIPIIEAIIKDGAVLQRPDNEFVSGRAALGVTVQNMAESDAAKYGAPLGVYVLFTTKGGAADKAGILFGDIILKFDGKEVKSGTELADLITAHKIGDVVQVEIYRGKATIDLSVTLGAATE
ncbi:MAG: trypsin-like peptidase domain-containing protein [Oscillospiraceae bacterium]|nr:trypsin-like peptidase domain-containing protein [Oscillospiraceae bacterium]